VNPEAIAALIELIQTLEPEAQAGIVGLVHMLHKKQLTTQDLLDQAAAWIAANPPTK
jgi:hypothetical protein